MKNNTILIVSMLLLLFSCGTPRIPVQYLEQEFDTAAYSKVVWRDLTFKTGDIISVEVKSDNPDAAIFYNQGGGTSNINSSTLSSSRSTVNSETGYIVSKNGTITLTGLGDINVGGKTKDEVSSLIVKELLQKDLLKNPTVDVRLLNFRVTVSGYVKVPGSISFSGDRVNLFQALAQAGELDKAANRNMITIMRERDGRRSFARLNINESEIFNSPFFQLEQNDVIMVPSRFKRDQEEADIAFRYVTLGLSALNLIAILLINVI